MSTARPGRLILFSAMFAFQRLASAEIVSRVHDHTPHSGLHTADSEVLLGKQEDSQQPSALTTHHAHDHGSGFRASLGLVAADYNTPLFSGEYQGVTATVEWHFARFSLAASVPLFRLRKNGLLVEGPGDAMLHAHGTAIRTTSMAAGFALMVSAPTGDSHRGLGMGHVMVMPGTWAMWSSGPVMAAGTLRFHRALGSTSAHASHGGGMWPLVDPMNASEVAGSGTAMLALARPFAIGANADAAVAMGNGEQRLSVGVRAVWVNGRTETSAGVDRGVVGQSFGVRGTLATSVQF